MLSRSGETWRPRISMSSPTLPITVSSAGSTTSTSPRRKRAPPTPPLKTVTFIASARPACAARRGARAVRDRPSSRCRRPGSGSPQARPRRQACARVGKSARRSPARRAAQRGSASTGRARSSSRRSPRRRRARALGSRPRASAGLARRRTGRPRSRRAPVRPPRAARQRQRPPGHLRGPGRRPPRARPRPARPPRRASRRRSSRRRGRPRGRPQAWRGRAPGARRRGGSRAVACHPSRGRERRSRPLLVGTIRVENTEIAAQLEAFAALLELNGASYYTARAYRRAAELIRDTPAPVAELVEQGRARELRGIGAGIEARLRELVETGELEELEELRVTLMPELVGLGHLLGVGPKRMRELAEALGVRTTDEFRAAVLEGRLPSVPGVGPKTEAKLRAGLERAAKPKPRRGLLLNRAWALAGGVADALGGEVAGDPRRWRDSCEDFAVVVAADEPEPILDAFEALTQIVSIVERDERRAIGVTVEGVPVELVVPPASSA